MASEWTTRHWGDIATLEYGKGLRMYNRPDGEYPVYGTNGPIGTHNEALFPKAGVVIGRKGAYRGVHYSKTPFYVIDTAFYLKPKAEIDMRWAYYQLLTHDINSMDSGSALPSTSRDSFYALPVKLPPLPEQQAIAHILGALDDKIEVNRQMNRTLEEMARAIFKSWFVDFDPVRRNVARRKGESVPPSPGVSAEIDALFPDSFEDSELGEIPKGWRVGKLGDVCEFSYGKALKEDDREGGDVPVYGSNGRVGWHSTRLSEGPGIIVGRKGNAGTVVWSPTDFFAIDTTFYVVPRGLIQSMRYLYETLKLEGLTELSADSAVPGLNRNIAYMSTMLVPSLQAVGAYDRLVKPMWMQQWSNETVSADLTQIRDALLPKLISGEIRLSTAESIMAAEVSR